MVALPAAGVVVAGVVSVVVSVAVVCSSRLGHCLALVYLFILLEEGANID